MLELFLLLLGYNDIDYSLCEINKALPEIGIVCEIPKEDLELLEEIDILEE